MCAQYARKQDEHAKLVNSTRDMLTKEQEDTQTALADHELKKKDIDPRLLDPANDNALFLPYQKEICFAAEDNELSVVEKSRRIGATWGLAGWCVLQAAAARSAGGQDVLYIGPSLDMAREFIDTCAVFAKALHGALMSVEEFILDDFDADGNSKDIKAFRLEFASSFEIIALTSHPRSLRGRQGTVIIDEAAFHDDLDEVLKAAIALQIWEGKTIVLSTHNGESNPFNTLIEDIRAGRREGKVIRVTFDDALKQGLYKRICYVKGKKWSPEGEKEWAAKIRKTYGTAAEEELDAVPTHGSGTVLSLAVIERAARTETPVVRWVTPKGFMDIGPEAREQYTRAWFERVLDPIMRETIVPGRQSYFGQDFGRIHDLTVIWPLQIGNDMTRRTPFVLELADCPFETQKEILFHVIEALPRFGGGAMDAGGNGQYLAESAQLRFGSDIIEGVMLSEGWYRDNMPRMVADLTDDNLTLPKDLETINDFRLLKRVRGVIRVPDKRVTSKETGAKRHGDSCIAAALACYAVTRNPVAYEFQSTGQARISETLTGMQVTDETAVRVLRGTGFGSVSGGINMEGFD